MSLAPSNAISEYQDVFVFLCARIGAAGITGEPAAQAQSMLEQLDGTAAEQVKKDRQVIAYRAQVAEDNVKLDGAMVDLDAFVRMADRNDPTLHLRAVMIGDVPMSEIVRPSGVGLARQLDVLDAILGKEALLPPAPALQVLHDHMAQLRTLGAVVRQHLAQLTDAIDQQRFCSARIKQLKESARGVLDTIRGELMAIYPRRREVVNSFFYNPAHHAADNPPDKPDNPPASQA